MELRLFVLLDRRENHHTRGCFGPIERTLQRDQGPAVPRGPGHARRDVAAWRRTRRTPFAFEVACTERRQADPYCGRWRCYRLRISAAIRFSFPHNPP